MWLDPSHRPPKKVKLKQTKKKRKWSYPGSFILLLSSALFLSWSPSEETIPVPRWGKKEWFHVRHNRHVLTSSVHPGSARATLPIHAGPDGWLQSITPGRRYRGGAASVLSLSVCCSWSSSDGPPVWSLNSLRPWRHTKLSMKRTDSDHVWNVSVISDSSLTLIQQH